ncbi:HAD-IA family hydrolase [Candidatus Saccharibacteria bacterium]|nr:HAD-IA family hydrolase [Candidatus Saccharibacteria bacterium]
MSTVPTAVNRKPALLIDCFGTISNRHYFWYSLEVLAYRLHLRRKLHVIAPEVVPVLRQLKPDYLLVFFSNSYHPWMYRGITAQALDDLFDHIVISSEVRSRKPSEKIFRHALDRIQRRPEECTLIDNAARNNRTAARIGMQTVHFTSQHQLYEILRKRTQKA